MSTTALPALQSTGPAWRPPAGVRERHPAATWDLRGPRIAEGSRWGYDAALECWWAEVVDEDGRRVRVAPTHLIPTVEGLARTLARLLSRPEDELYLALTGR